MLPHFTLKILSHNLYLFSVEFVVFISFDTTLVESMVESVTSFFAVHPDKNNSTQQKDPHNER